MMATLRRLLLRLLQAVRPGRAEAELDREVRSHIELIESDLVRRGTPPAQAHAAALRALGGIEQTKIRHRDARSIRWLDEVRGDIRQARRSLLRHWRVTAVAVLILGTVGAANAVTLGIADAVLFKPLPYARPANLGVLMMQDPKTGQKGTRVPYAVLQHLGEPTPAISAVGFQDTGPRIVLDTPDGPLGILTASTTVNYFNVLGVRPHRGRLFSETDAGNPRAALITYRTWQTRLGGHEDIVGQTVRLGNTAIDVVGILPDGLFTPSVFSSPDAVPELFVARAFPAAAEEGGVFLPVVRFANGVTRDQAQTALSSLTSSGVRDETGQSSMAVLEAIDEVLFPAGRPIMRWLMASTAALLVLACVNLATLIFIRGQSGAREIGVKLSLGASSARIVRPLLFEIAALGLIGGILAVGLAYLTFGWVLPHVPTVAYGQAPVGVNARVSLLTVGLAMASALAFTFVPAWISTRRTAAALIARGSSRSVAQGWTFGRPLVALQVALAVVLVFGAVVTGQAFVTLLQVPLGFDSSNVATVTIAPPAGDNSRDFALRALDVLRQRPDVISAGAAGSRPFDGTAPDDGVKREKGARMVGIAYALPGYFETIGMRTIAGRTFGPRDPYNNPDSAVVSESAARELFGTSQPLGATFTNGRGRTFHVIGVVSDIRHFLTGDNTPRVFVVPLTTVRRPLTLVVKTRSKTETVLQDLRQSLRPLSPTARVTAGWWNESISSRAEFKNPRFQTLVLGTLGVVGLALTTLGIVGVVGFLVRSRSREIGIRTVIGATPARLVREVVRQALAPVTVGLGVGLVLTRGVAALAKTQLFPVETADPGLLVVTGSVILVATVLAAYLPARRAGRVDPAIVLRGE